MARSLGIFWVASGRLGLFDAQEHYPGQRVRISHLEDPFEDPAFPALPGGVSWSNAVKNDPVPDLSGEKPGGGSSEPR